ncbi:unnamed protein product [Nesidiocoris tenuis]|uniref:Uncharacterized protein n=1 Tax=Nesidiocoris tenuis TaxID=355587 RepID=A0A6H5H8Q0_9HEMI|nr:unnamed protein product [Nesidiocoris tenuis]
MTEFHRNRWIKKSIATLPPQLSNQKNIFQKLRKKSHSTMDNLVSGVGDGDRRVGDGCVGDGRALVNDRVEPVDGVGRVLDGPHRAVRFDQGVAALHDVAVAAFVLLLLVAGQCVLDLVRVAVLGMRVVVFDGVGDGLSDGSVRQGDGSVRQGDGRSQELGCAGGRQEREGDDRLEIGRLDFDTVTQRTHSTSMIELLSALSSWLMIND